MKTKIWWLHFLQTPNYIFRCSANRAYVFKENSFSYDWFYTLYLAMGYFLVDPIFMLNPPAKKNTPKKEFRRHFFMTNNLI